MGLDMYLNKKIYVWNEDRKLLKITGIKSKVNPDKVSYIIEEAGYWRKANAIHKWFVENVQDGEDDCKEYYVSEEQLKKLLETVNKVLNSTKLVKGKRINGYEFRDGKKYPCVEDGLILDETSVAKKLLPTEEGFFFGGTEYDEYYLEDLKLTKKILEEALSDSTGEFTYRSSW